MERAQYGLTKVVIASHIHGLANAASDIDFLEIVRTPDCTARKSEINSVTTYELREYISEAVSGNGTLYEAICSTEVVYTSELAEELRENWHKLVHSERYFLSCMGYVCLPCS